MKERYLLLSILVGACLAALLNYPQLLAPIAASYVACYLIDSLCKLKLNLDELDQLRINNTSLQELKATLAAHKARLDSISDSSKQLGEIETRLSAVALKLGISK